jgi:hypothetical protein
MSDILIKNLSRKRKTMKKLIFTVLFIALLSFSIFADIRLPDTPKPSPTPKQQKEIDSNMIIRLDPNADEATLVIPKSQISQLRAQLDGLDTEPLLSFSRTQTIVSGLFLSLAIVFGGVWFARRGKPNKLTVAGAVLLLLGSAATVVFANVGPPTELRSISGKLFDKKTFQGWSRASGKIKIKVAENGNAVELLVPDKVE